MRLRRQRGIAIGLAQSAEEASHLDERAPGGVLDRGARRACEFRIDRERALRGIGLHRDHADAVGNLVVELAGDPRTLLLNRPAGALALLALEPRGQQPLIA